MAYVLKSELPALIQKHLDENGYAKGEHLDITNYKGDIHLMDKSGNTVIKSAATPNGSIILGNNNNRLDLSCSALFITQPSKPDGFLKVSGSDGMATFTSSTVGQFLENYTGKININTENSYPVLFTERGYISLAERKHFESNKFNSTGISVTSGTYSSADGVVFSVNGDYAHAMKIKNNIVGIQPDEPERNRKVNIRGNFNLLDRMGNNVIYAIPSNVSPITLGHKKKSENALGHITINKLSKLAYGYSDAGEPIPYLVASESSLSIGELVPHQDLTNTKIFGDAIIMDRFGQYLALAGDSLSIINASGEMFISADTISIGIPETNTIKIGGNAENTTGWLYQKVSFAYVHGGSLYRLSDSGTTEIKANVS